MIRRTGGGVQSFEQLQERLADALALNRPGSGTAHVLVALPSYSINESLLSHYRDRIASLEHRYLLASLMLGRIESCEMIFVSSAAPDDDTLEYYRSLVPEAARASMQERFVAFPVPGGSDRSVAARLLDRPDLLDALRDRIGGRPAFIEPWNVTDAEVGVACRLGVPVNGTAPHLWPLGFKSAGRRMFREAGVPVPVGREDVRSVDGVLDAVRMVRRRCPDVRSVVVKHDESGAGDGNAVIDVRDGEVPATDTTMRTRLGALPPWYLADLRHGGVVEELVAGDGFASPSVQIDLEPGGRVVVLSTHDQVLGGDSAQVYTGCRFPADPAYASEIAAHGRAVGEALARRGALGRASVDFVAVRDGGQWRVAALEVNLRKGGTTHPFAALRNLVPGRYDEERARWVTDDGSTRAYCATDNLVDPAWTGLEPYVVIDAVADAGLQFDPSSGRGVVLHMLSCLAIDGRFGLTAIAHDPDEAAGMYDAAVLAIAARAVW
jgi:hypothetical protein